MVGAPESFKMHPECKEATASWDDWDWECFEPGSLKQGEDE